MLTSILDNDFYKFTMQNAIVKLFPRAKVRYKFINRGKNRFPDGFDQYLKENINKLTELKLTSSELLFLKEKCSYLDPTYIDFLQGYRFDDNEVKIALKNGALQVIITGYWYRTILWEVPLLAIISELFFRLTGRKTYSQKDILLIAKKKALRYNKIKVRIADFGTRRRYSYTNHDIVVNVLSKYGSSSFIGTSNVHFAMKYSLIPIGTHAHEWFMFHGAKYGYKMANRLAMEHWVDIYRGNLGIALSDTYTSKIFFKDFDIKFAKLFDGVRHDSGDPIEFANRIIAHYKKFNINPNSKTIIFSDGLNPDKVEEIADFCRNKINISFGIGTDFTNDVGVEPLNIVIKMVEAKPECHEWTPTVKLSDTVEKYIGGRRPIQLCKDILNIKDP
ncbi:MAG: nicotinate phosphoribosyltransferase [Desulfosarcina sp.]|nr:nicotinate phosphoribosyltransferase [Desulfobacterales bacterium]